MQNQIGSIGNFRTGAEQCASKRLNGDNASYTLRARWMDKDGKPVELTKQVQVQGGKEVEVDFTNETVPLPKGSK